MSLVGTRPPTVDEWEKYEAHHRKRLAIKPGITGMWQVSGRSEITDFERVVELDTEYITGALFWKVSRGISVLAFRLSVASFAHVFVFGYEVARVIIVLNDTTVFCESIGIRKSLNGTHFG